MGGMRLMKAVLQLRFMIMKEYNNNTYIRIPNMKILQFSCHPHVNLIQKGGPFLIYPTLYIVRKQIVSMTRYLEIKDSIPWKAFFSKTKKCQWIWSKVKMQSFVWQLNVLVESPKMCILFDFANKRGSSCVTNKRRVIDMQQDVVKYQSLGFSVLF